MDNAIVAKNDAYSATKFTMTVMNLGSEFFAAASYEFDD